MSQLSYCQCQQPEALSSILYQNLQGVQACCCVLDAFWVGLLIISDSVMRWLLLFWNAGMVHGLRCDWFCHHLSQTHALDLSPHTIPPPPSISSLPDKRAYASVLPLELQRSWPRLLIPAYRPSVIHIHIHDHAVQTHLVVVSG